MNSLQERYGHAARLEADIHDAVETMFLLHFRMAARSPLCQMLQSAAMSVFERAQVLTDKSQRRDEGLRIGLLNQSLGQNLDCRFKPLRVLCHAGCQLCALEQRQGCGGFCCRIGNMQDRSIALTQ